jgi:hypothetical protein
MVSLSEAFAQERLEGNWVALAATLDESVFPVTYISRFPRYYFDLARAMAEVESWLFAHDQIEIRSIPVSEEVFEQIREYFGEFAGIDRRADNLLVSIGAAWAAPFGPISIEGCLFDAIKSFIEPRTTLDRKASQLFAELIRAEVQEDSCNQENK